MKTITEFPGIKLKDGVMLLKSIIDEKKATRAKAQLEAKLLAKGAKEKFEAENKTKEEIEPTETTETTDTTDTTENLEASATPDLTETPAPENTDESALTVESTSSETTQTPVEASSSDGATTTEETPSKDVAEAAAPSEEPSTDSESDTSAESSGVETAAEKTEEIANQGGKNDGKVNKSEELKALRQQEREETTNELRGLLEKTYNVEGEKLEFLLNAVLTVDRRRITDIRRVVVLQLEDGEAEPKGVQKRGEHFYRAEYLPPLKKDKKRFSKGRGRGNQKRGKRRFDKKRRPRRPEGGSDSPRSNRGKRADAPHAASRS